MKVYIALPPLPFEKWRLGARVYEVWNDDGVVIGYVERRDGVPVFDGATPHNPTGFHRETQWVAFLANGTATDEAHSRRRDAVAELVRKAGPS